MEKIYKTAEVSLDKKYFDLSFTFKITVLFALLALGHFKEEANSTLNTFFSEKSSITPNIIKANTTNQVSAAKTKEIEAITVSITTD